MLYPSIRDDSRGLGDAGSLALFAGLNVLAFVLVFFLVEETKGRSLEDLDLVFAVSKRRFMSFQISEYLPWFIKRYIFWKDAKAPELYHDMIWGPTKRDSEASAPHLQQASLHNTSPPQPYYEPQQHGQGPLELSPTYSRGGNDYRHYGY